MAKSEQLLAGDKGDRGAANRARNSEVGGRRGRSPASEWRRAQCCPLDCGQRKIRKMFFPKAVDAFR